MKKNIIFMLVLLLLIGCTTATKKAENNPMKPIKKSSIADKIANLKDSKNKEIIVVAHRGDWRNAPENSLQAIQYCIDMGVDMVEIDIHETKDGHLVLMHDKTIDRTTTGKGAVKDLTLEELKKVYLIDGLRNPTKHKIPTLEEALLVAKNKILVNLDKSYSIFDKCYEIIKKTGTLNQVVIKGFKTKEEVNSEFGDYLDKVFFMPIVDLANEKSEKIVNTYLDKNIPVAFEFLVPQDTLKLVNRFKSIREKGASIWVNSLWGIFNSNHEDERAVKDINVYKWYVDHHVDIIQTDRPKLLLEYLRSKGLHD